MKELIMKKISLEKILGFYIVVQFLIDVATAFCVNHISESLSIGIFVRTIFMIVIVLYSLVKSDKKDRIKMIIYYGVLGAYMLAFLAISYKVHGTSFIMSQIKGLIKTFYLPIILVAFMSLFKNKNIHIKSSIFVYALMGYIAIISICKFLGISYLSYPIGNGEGTMGLFYAANEIGVIIAMLAPFLAYELLTKKVKVVNIVALILFIFASLELGTKVPILSLILLSLASLYICIVKIIRKEEKTRNIRNFMATIVVCLITVFAIPYMPIGTNLSNVYGINIPRVLSVFSKEKNKVPVQNVPKFETKEDVENAVYSSRTFYLKDNIKRYKDSIGLQKIAGIGYVTNNRETGESMELKLVEMDYCDIILCHGILGTIIYVIPYIYIIVIEFKKLLKNWKNIFIDSKNVFMEYAIIISLVVALTAGHVFTAPAPALFLAIIMIETNKRLKTRGE